MSAKIFPAPSEVGCTGFYVAADLVHPEDMRQRQTQYLHDDGRWRLSCKSDRGLTGYFPTRRQAQSALSSAGSPSAWLHG